jgi:AhpD family alkylhydroperoxidase
MEQRMDAYGKAPGVMKAMYGLELYLAKSSLDKQLLHLIKYRVSQINGCAYCLDMHSKDLRAGGETEQRLYTLDAWRETPFFTPRERAALEWAESVTLVSETHVPDEVYESVRKEFSEEELIDLTLAVATINAWNRFAISFRTTPGTYQPGQHSTAA